MYGGSLIIIIKKIYINNYHYYCCCCCLRFINKEISPSPYNCDCCNNKSSSKLPATIMALNCFSLFFSNNFFLTAFLIVFRFISFKKEELSKISHIIYLKLLSSKLIVWHLFASLVYSLINYKVQKNKKKTKKKATIHHFPINIYCLLIFSFIFF